MLTFPDEYPLIHTDDYEVVWSDAEQAAAAVEDSTPVQSTTQAVSSAEADFWTDWADWQRAVFIIAIIIAVTLLVVVLVVASYYFCCQNR